MTTMLANTDTWLRLWSLILKNDINQWGSHCNEAVTSTVNLDNYIGHGIALLSECQSFDCIR